MKYAIYTKDAPRPYGHSSQGTSAARYIFISGLTGHKASDQSLPDSFEEELDQALRNASALLAELDMNFSDVTKATIWLLSEEKIATVDKIWRQYFDSPAPTRSIVGAAWLPDKAQVQLELVACR